MVESASPFSFDRRRFVTATAAVGAAAAGVAAAPDAFAAAASTTASAGQRGPGSAYRPKPGSLTHSIKDAKHIVVLMQENRSFDHYYGALRGVRGYGDQATITLAGGYGVFDQPNGSARQYPWAFDQTTPADGASAELLSQCNGDLAHS